MLQRHGFIKGKEGAKPYQVPLCHMTYALQGIHKRARVPATTADNCTTRGRQDVRVVQQLCLSTKTKFTTVHVFQLSM